MVRYLLRLLFRLHLAPNREQRYHAAKIMAANENAAKREIVRQSKSKQLKGRRNHVRNALRKQKWELEKKSKQNKLSNRQGDGYHKRIEYLQSVLGDLVRDDLEELALHDGLDANGYEQDEVAASIAQSGVSARRLASLQGVLKRALWNEPDLVLTDKLLAQYAIKLDLSINETFVLKKIHYVMKPFVLPDQPNYCHLNLLFFGNAVLRLCGYDQFTMLYAPHVSTGSLYSLSMDAASLFGMFGKPLEIKRDHGVKSAIDARHNKEKVFACLFDMNAIHDICKKNGIAFIYRLDISPANDVTMQGLIVKPRQVSMYEQRLKQAKPNLQPPSTQHTLDTLKTDISEAEKERNRMAKTNCDACNALMKHRRAMKDTDYAYHSEHMPPSLSQAHGKPAGPKDISNTPPTGREDEPSKKFADVKWSGS
ncbi:hypothetical protein DM01DRAFT_1386297 [Hesseltinella vesiculosa]|uniref:Uncharacterized protein n=1 Tax=Hesseltinella vesiculosa TaxID=101127 RepID=A0A1X2G7P2_9FUNG|nr:hypothetical protein DM01DRAFT_1386297 [Hesseltinella vesiculosa]